VVSAVERVSPVMTRVTLAGDSLSDFVSAAPDDHVKLLLPQLGGTLVKRDFTPRAFNRETGELIIDFVNHGGGVAASWARGARPGDPISIAGPKASKVMVNPLGKWMFIGDETALPAIGRWVGELGAAEEVTTLVAVPGREDEQQLNTPARLKARWVHRPQADAHLATPLLSALRGMGVGQETFVWIAAEASVARGIRDYLIAMKGISGQWIRASGYWIASRARRT
jgi:NADPH-dependent ferric siderophore reductase